MTTGGLDPRAVLLAYAEAVPPGHTVSVPREWILDALRAPLSDEQVEAMPHLLSPAQVAKRLGVTLGHVYRIWKQVPGAVKLGHRQLRFTPEGLARYLAGRTP